jgi:hypothetical protein
LSFSCLSGVANAAVPERLHPDGVIFGAFTAESEMRKAWLAIAILLGGCVNHPAIRPLKPLEIATAPYHWGPTAVLTGSLMYEGDCLLFRDEQTGALLLPVWPTGSEFNGMAVRFHQPAKTDQRLLIAEQFQMEGVPASWPALAGEVYEPFQRECGMQPFYVSTVRPAN